MDLINMPSRTEHKNTRTMYSCKKEELIAIMDAIGFTLVRPKQGRWKYFFDKETKELVKCCECQRKITFDNLGNIFSKPTQILCDSVVCFATFSTKYLDNEKIVWEKLK